MKVSGTYKLPMAPERAYAILQDPEILAQCLPGCDQLVQFAEHEYKMKLKMVLASISGQFDGKVRVADRQAPGSFRLIVEGQGKIGFVKGDGLLTLSGDGGGTQVSYDGQVNIGGAIAAVGQRLLDATSKMMIRKFFEKLAQTPAVAQL